MFSNTCAVCGATFTTAQPAVTCSGACRNKRHRARERARIAAMTARLAAAEAALADVAPRNR